MSINVIRTETYVTTDGRKFKTRDEAIEHQVLINVYAKHKGLLQPLFEAIKRNDYSYWRPSLPFIKKIIQHRNVLLINQRERRKQIVSGVVELLEGVARQAPSIDKGLYITSVTLCLSGRAYSLAFHGGKVTTTTLNNLEAGDPNVGNLLGARTGNLSEATVSKIRMFLAAHDEMLKEYKEAGK